MKGDDGYGNGGYTADSVFRDCFRFFYGIFHKKRAEHEAGENFAWIRSGSDDSGFRVVFADPVNRDGGG